MRNESHKTFIGIIKAGVIEWRKREGWSRETVAQAIVDAHVAIGGPDDTGIVFDPETRDAFSRQKVNADRIFRWLDDESKDNNLLPANFIKSVLKAMPLDIRMHVVGEWLGDVGLNVSAVGETVDHDLNVSSDLCEMLKENAEALQAVAHLMNDKNQAALATAEKELTDAIVVKTRIRDRVRGALAKARKVFHLGRAA